MELRFLHSGLLLLPVVGIGLEDLPAQKSHDDHVDGSHRRHERIAERVHDGDIGDACGAERDDDDEYADEQDVLLAVLDEPGVGFAHGVVSDQAGECEDEHEERDDVVRDVPHGIRSDGLNQVCSLESECGNLREVAVGKNDECGDGAHDEGVDEDTEGLDHSLLDRVLDVRSGRDVGDGTETCLVGEHSSLQTGDDYGSDSSAEGAGNGECVLEDHRDGVDHSTDVEADGDECEDDPEDGHDGDDLCGELRRGLQSLEQDEGCERRDDDGEHEVVVLEVEGTAESAGSVTGLDPDEPDTEGQDEEDRGDDTEFPVAETLGGVVGGTTVEVTVLLLLLEDLGEGGFHEAAGGTDDGEDPHPEDRSGTTHHDGGSDSGDVSYADTGAHSDTERFERGDLGGLLTLRYPGKRE